MNELLKNDFINLCNNNQIISTYMLRDINDDYLEKNKMNNVDLIFKQSNLKSFDSNSKDYMNTYLEGFGGYQNNVIKMYRNKLMLYYLYLYKKDNIYQLSNDEIIKFNISCINLLIHELTHAKQDQIVKNIIDAKKPIHDLLEADFNQVDVEFYDKFYDLFASEYNANMEASIYINKLINNTNLKKFNNNETLNLIKKAYKGDALASRFLKLVGEDINTYNLDELTTKEKVLYGFPRK